jgi:flagellar hook-length control protein FliK
LDPPQLGNLLIELHRDKEEIKATLWADNPKTKEILENNQFQLQKTLEADGFKLEKYEVFVQKDMGSFQGNEESPVFHGQQNPKQSLGIQEAESPQPLEILPGVIRAAGGSRYVDRFI